MPYYRVARRHYLLSDERIFIEGDARLGIATEGTQIGVTTVKSECLQPSLANVTVNTFQIR